MPSARSWELGVMVTWVLRLQLIAEYMPMLREHRCTWVHNSGTRMAQGKSRIWEAFGWISLATLVVGSKEVVSSTAPGGLLEYYHVPKGQVTNCLLSFTVWIDLLGKDKGRVKPVCWNFIFHINFEMPCVWFNVKVPQVHSICTKKSSWSLWLWSEFESSCTQLCVPLLNF